MHWTEEHQILCDTMVDLFPAKRAIRSLAQELNLVGEIDFEGPPVDVWTDFVATADSFYKLPGLILRALARYPNSRELGVLGAFQWPETAGRRPSWVNYLLGGRAAFVHRGELRAKLRNVHKPYETLTLTVAGPVSSGKSYVSELIRFLQGPKGIEFCEFRMDDATTPEHLADEMKRALGGGEDLVKGAGNRDEDAAKWYRYVCQNFVDALVEKQRNSTGLYWIIVDDANHLDESLGVPVMLAQLSLAVFNAGREKIRLVILGCREGLEQVMDTRDSRRIRRRVDTADLDYLSESDVRQFLVELLEDAKNDQLGPVRDDVSTIGDVAVVADQLVEQVMDYAKALPPRDGESRPKEFMFRLCTQLEEIVDGILER